MKLELNNETTKITNITQKRVQFLGVDIFRSKLNTKFYTNYKYVRTRVIKGLIMEAPKKKIYRKLAEAKFIINNKPNPKFI